MLIFPNETTHTRILKFPHPPSCNICIGLILRAVFELHPLDRMAKQFRCVLQFELALDVLAMRFDGLDAQVKIFGDLAGRCSVSDHFEDLQFPIGQAFCGKPAGLGWTVDKLREHPGRHLLGEVNFTANNLPDGRQNSLGWLALGHLTFGSGTQYALGIESLIVHGQNQNLDIRKADLHIFDKLDSAGILE